MVPFPEVMTHNYDPERGPFRNLCELPVPEAESVLDEIRAAGNRRIKANYLRRRLEVEDWLLRESRKKERRRTRGFSLDEVGTSSESYAIAGGSAWIWFSACRGARNGLPL